jgi:hypothetical protein
MNDLAPGRGIGELTDHPYREARNVLKAGRHTPELETGRRTKGIVVRFGAAGESRTDGNADGSNGAPQATSRMRSSAGGPREGAVTIGSAGRWRLVRMRRMTRGRRIDAMNRMRA